MKSVSPLVEMSNLFQGKQEKVKLICSCTNVSQNQSSGGRGHIFGLLKPLSEAKLKLQLSQTQIVW